MTPFVRTLPSSELIICDSFLEGKHLYRGAVNKINIKTLEGFENLRIGSQFSTFTEIYKFQSTCRLPHLCPAMQALTKMADLTKFRQTDVGQNGDFYANDVTRDIPDMLAILAIFMQIMSPETSLTCWRTWRFWRFLCKLRHQRHP